MEEEGGRVEESRGREDGWNFPPSLSLRPNIPLGNMLSKPLICFLESGVLQAWIGKEKEKLQISCTDPITMKFPESWFKIQKFYENTSIFVP